MIRIQFKYPLACLDGLIVAALQTDSTRALAWLRAGRFQDFAWWCIPLGIVVIAWQLATS